MHSCQSCVHVLLQAGFPARAEGGPLSCASYKTAQKKRHCYIYPSPPLSTIFTHESTVWFEAKCFHFKQFQNQLPKCAIIWHSQRRLWAHCSCWCLLSQSLSPSVTWLEQGAHSRLLFWWGAGQGQKQHLGKQGVFCLWRSCHEVLGFCWVLRLLNIFLIRDAMWWSSLLGACAFGLQEMNGTCFYSMNTKVIFLPILHAYAGMDDAMTSKQHPQKKNTRGSFFITEEDSPVCNAQRQLHFVQHSFQQCSKQQQHFVTNSFSKAHICFHILDFSLTCCILKGLIWKN